MAFNTREEYIMKHRILQYLPYLNRETLMVVYVLLILAAMVMAGGAPMGNYGSGGL